jgi:hypothetical protein
VCPEATTRCCAICCDLRVCTRPEDDTMNNFYEIPRVATLSHQKKWQHSSSAQLKAPAKDFARSFHLTLHTDNHRQKEAAE